MKKIRLLAIVLLSVLLFASLGNVCSAEGENIIAEDYSYIIYNGVKYVRVNHLRDNVDMTYTYVDDNDWHDVELTEAQSETLRKVEINVGDEIARVYYYFNGHDGSSYSYYVPESLLDMYNAIARGEYSGLRVVVNQSVNITRDQLDGDAVSMSGEELFEYCRYSVYISSPEREIERYIGHLIYDLDGNCYYLDFSENGITSSLYCALDYESFIIHKITDEAIIDLINVETVYEMDSSYVIAMTILLLIVFAIIPGGIVVFLVMRRRKEDGLHKKLINITIILGIVLILIAVILAFMVIPYI